jgi:hypothetical protein
LYPSPLSDTPLVTAGHSRPLLERAVSEVSAERRAATIGALHYVDNEEGKIRCHSLHSGCAVEFSHIIKVAGIKPE